jgi:hypothetical protein
LEMGFGGFGIDFSLEIQTNSDRTVNERS